MKKKLFASILCMAMLYGCGNSEQSDPKQAESATTISSIAEKESPEQETTDSSDTDKTAQDSSIADSTKSDEPEKIVSEYTDNDVTAAQNWMTDMWNDCVDIKAYVESGTDCTGEEIDIDFFVESAKIDYEKKDKYNDIIHSLDDTVDGQKMLIMSWDKCIEQVDSLLVKAFEETPRPNDESYEFNTDLFRQYFKEFDDSIRTVMFGDSNVNSYSVTGGEPKFTFKT